MFDYNYKTTFFNDFTIADMFGIEAVKDTYKRAFAEWKDNVEYITELTIVLNHKIWQHYETNEPLARVYDKLWRELDTWCCENLKGKDLEYFYQTTD
jgi:hypothetical protein